jgi:hypothetical protein
MMCGRILRSTSKDVLMTFVAGGGEVGYARGSELIASRDLVHCGSGLSGSLDCRSATTRIPFHHNLPSQDALVECRHVVARELS